MTSKSLWRALTISLLLFIVLQPTRAAAQSIILYGTCAFGGKNMDPQGITFGTIYEYFIANDSIAVVYNFDSINGAFPSGSLIQATDGKLYGLTLAGGAHSGGVLFQYDPVSGLFTKKYDFTDTLAGGSFGRLIQVGNKLYGLTNGGGQYYILNSFIGGTLFSYDLTTDTYSDLHDFGDSTDGSAPHGSLTLFNNTLYGMTSGGGAHSAGILFQYDLSDSAYAKVFDFDTTASGIHPGEMLTVAGNGRLYSITSYGGDNGFGTLIELNPANDSVNKKYDFTADNLSGWGRLLLATDGNLYGLTKNFSSLNAGILYEYVPGADTIIIKSDLGADSITYASGDLIQLLPSGLLYSAGSNIFSFDYNSDIYTPLKSFTYSSGYAPNGFLAVDLTTGIDNINTSNLSLYPNPASNEVTIQNLSSKQNAQVSITDITGRTLTTNYTNLGGKIVLDIHSFSPGIYLVELKQDSVNYTGRFVKMD